MNTSKFIRSTLLCDTHLLPSIETLSFVHFNSIFKQKKSCSIFWWMWRCEIDCVWLNMVKLMEDPIKYEVNSSGWSIYFLNMILKNTLGFTRYIHKKKKTRQKKIELQVNKWRKFIFFIFFVSITFYVNSRSFFVFCSLCVSHSIDNTQNLQIWWWNVSLYAFSHNVVLKNDIKFAFADWVFSQQLIFLNPLTALWFTYQKSVCVCERK